MRLGARNVKFTRNTLQHSATLGNPCRQTRTRTSVNAVLVWMVLVKPSGL